MSESKSKKILIGVAVWGFIIIALVVGFKLFTGGEDEELVEKTSSDSQYKHTVKLHLDPFSGYAIFRSDSMQHMLRKQGIKLKLEDDAGNYTARLKALKSGKADMAVFPINSLITTGVKTGEWPAPIVFVIDESKGADAIVAYKSSVKSVQDLDSKDARIVVTPDSPSEFLAQILIAQFSLPSLPEKWAVEANGSDKVLEKFKASRGQKKAFVMWEPDVSAALEDKDAHVLLDSGKVSGYIVDTLVVNRTFLNEHPELVRAVIDSYLRTSYSYANRDSGMNELVKDDLGMTVSSKQLDKLVSGIEWKNTKENYGYFGIEAESGVPHLEDVIGNITRVLIQTGALDDDPLEDRRNTIFYDGIMRSLHADKFHPATQAKIVEGLGPTSDDLDNARLAPELRPLSDKQWSELKPVGNLRVEPLGFVRGSDELSDLSKSDLDVLAQQLKSMPRYYVRIVGHARSDGNSTANARLSRDRAESVRLYLIDQGISESRFHAEAQPPSKSDGSAQAVSFVVGTAPY